MANTGSMVRVGIVSSRDTSEHTVRCFFPDRDNAMSGWLRVLKSPGTSSTLPGINDRVLVVYPDGFNMDGYVMGVIQ